MLVTLCWMVRRFANSDVKVAGLDVRWTYPAPMVSLLMRRVETFGWLLDAVKADKIPLVVVSNTNRGRSCMTESKNRRAAYRKDRAQKLQKWDIWDF